MQRLPRQWIINVIYALVGDPFRLWVSQQVKERNDHVAEQNDLMIELDPQIAAAFKGSLNISSKSIVLLHRFFAPALISSFLQPPRDEASTFLSPEVNVAATKLRCRRRPATRTLLKRIWKQTPPRFGSSRKRLSSSKSSSKKSTMSKAKTRAQLISSALGSIRATSSLTRTACPTLSATGRTCLSRTLKSQCDKLAPPIQRCQSARQFRRYSRYFNIRNKKKRFIYTDNFLQNGANIALSITDLRLS